MTIQRVSDREKIAWQLCLHVEKATKQPSQANTMEYKKKKKTHTHANERE